MSSWQCDLCNRYDEHCKCETVTRARWDAAKHAWLTLRAIHVFDAIALPLDALFFEGETAKAPAALTITGATSE